MLVRLGIWLLLATMILYGVLVWWCTNELAEPPRRQVQKIALPYLDGSAKAGFRVEIFTSSGGMPCAVCTPEKTEAFSKRAATIREQLKERGIEPARSGEILGTLVILHGRGGNKEDYFPVAERFCAVGFRCVIPDMPGHGENREKYATYGMLEAEMVLKCIEEAAAKYTFSEQQSAILGQSMGGSVAVHTAALEDSPFSSMVVISSFDRLETVVLEKNKRSAGISAGWRCG